MRDARVTWSARRQVTSAACVTADAAPTTSRSRASASGTPSRTATWSCSCSSRRLPARPVTRCRASRTSASRRTASSTSRCGRSATQEATTARTDTRSRSPPRPSLRSGSMSWRRSPCRAPRSSHASRSAGSRRRAAARQSARTVERSRPTRPGSPATWRASSRPSRTARSCPASRRPSSNVRTAWSRRTPESQIGYQTLSASEATVLLPAWSRTRSRSLPGESSPRPYPPTAASATPPFWCPVVAQAAANRSATHASVRADSSRLLARPGRPGLASRSRRCDW